MVPISFSVAKKSPSKRRALCKMVWGVKSVCRPNYVHADEQVTLAHHSLSLTSLNGRAIEAHIHTRTHGLALWIVPSPNKPVQSGCSSHNQEEAKRTHLHIYCTMYGLRAQLQLPSYSSSILSYNAHIRVTCMCLAYMCVARKPKWHEECKFQQMKYVLFSNSLLKLCTCSCFWIRLTHMQAHCQHTASNIASNNRLSPLISVPECLCVALTIWHTTYEI